jgi:hypothetical protein
MKYDWIAAQKANRDNGASAGNFNTNNDVDYACPVSGLPMNGRYRFVALRKTGHVISEKALKEVREDSFYTARPPGPISMSARRQIEAGR